MSIESLPPLQGGNVSGPSFKSLMSLIRTALILRQKWPFYVQETSVLYSDSDVEDMVLDS